MVVSKLRFSLLLPAVLAGTLSLAPAHADETGRTLPSEEPKTPPLTGIDARETTPQPFMARAELTNTEIQQIAQEAFVYGYPMVVGYGVMHDYAIDAKAAEYKAPFNQIYNTARVYTPKDTAVVTPNSDTPYSFAWADLRAEPLIFQVPKVKKERYYSVQLVDLYTFNYGYVGSRATGDGPGTFMIVGPHWKGKKPAGVDRVFRCQTDFSFVIFRTQLFGPEDLGNVKKVQAGYKVEPLSSFLGKSAPVRRPIAWPAFDKAKAATNPLAFVNFVLQFCPASEEERALRERFARIGVEAGKPFPPANFTAAQKAALAAGIKRGQVQIKERVAAIGRAEKGWRLGSAAGDRAFYKGDWLLRAAGAMAGIYGNSQAEAFYPFLVTDSQGRKPDGSANRYTMTFPAGKLPPAHSFWSLTMYDAQTQFLVENPIQRYLINSPMLSQLKKNPDGSMTLYVQKESPGKDKESNWLPAPDGPIFLVMRLYWPEREALDGSWTPPPLVPLEPVGMDAKGQSPTDERPGNKSPEIVARTDERYGHDRLFQGPRGWAYWKMLKNPRPIQNPNLWPDTQSTYFLARFAMPPGSRLTVPFKFPRARYFQFALYKSERNTFVSIGEALSGPSIEPDTGSTNPFRVGADRLAEKRDCTLRVVAEDPPSNSAERQQNTLYVGKDGGELQAVVRIYLPDQGWDGAGWGLATAPSPESGFRYEGSLADGTQLSMEQVCKQFAKPLTMATKPPLTADQWIGLVNSPGNDPALDPATSPARREPKWQKYWGMPYSIFGGFKTPAELAKVSYGGAIDGGGDPSTQYFLTHLSRKFGPVYVMHGKMPTFPDTYAGQDGRGLALTPEAQMQYWSLVSCEAAPSGQIVDGLTDMQVPLDADRNYTIVCSRREDRPRNATLENGVAWVEWSPRGEGLDDPRNRENFGMLMLRIMATNPSWKERPDNVTKPGMEEAVMGPYLPRGEYTDKARFEARGEKP